MKTQRGPFPGHLISDRLVSDRLAERLPFFYGYVMIPIAMMLQVCTSPGQTFAISAFTPSLRESLQLSDSRLSLAYMLGTFFAAFPLSYIGYLSDRWGLRVITVIVAAALSVTCWIASQATGFATLLVAFFLLRFLGQGSLSLLSANSISMWFRSRLGRVCAVMSVGGAIAFAWTPQWISESIEVRGWRETYQAIGIIVAVAVLPTMILLFRNRPEDLNQNVDGVSKDAPHVPPQQSSVDAPKEPSLEPELNLAQALRHRAFYILSLTNCVWALAGTGVLFYLFTLCEDRHFADSLAPALFKTLGMSMLAAQLVGGYFVDRWQLNRLLGIGAMLVTVGIGLACIGDTTAKMHGFAAFFGAGQGTLLAVGSAVWVRYYGRAHLGSIRGTAMCLMVAGSGCGPLVMGIIRDHFGTFDRAIQMFFVVLAVLSMLSWWATAPPDLRTSGPSERIDR